MHAILALDEYMCRGQGSQFSAPCWLSISLEPASHTHDAIPVDPLGDVEPATKCIRYGLAQ